MKYLIKKYARSLVEKTFGPKKARQYYDTVLVPMIKSQPDRKPIQKGLEKILQINTVDNQGGAAKVAFRLHKALERKGYDAKMLVRESMVSDPNIKEVRNKRRLQQFILSCGERRMGWQDFIYPAALEIREMDWLKECDILHLHNLHGNYFSIFALPELTACKQTVWTLHDMHSITGHCAHSFDCNQWTRGCGNCPDLSIYPELYTDTTAYLWETKKRLYELSELTVVCPSKWLMNKVEKSILKNKEIHLVYNGIDRSVFRPINRDAARRKLNLPQNKKILLFNAQGGKDNPWKGGQYLIKAYEKLQDRDELLFLNIGGNTGSADKMNWRDISYISDEQTLALYYSAADVFIHPSLADNCPLVVLEAMSCGTPVISFQTGGIPELVNHLCTGYLAKYKDLDDFIKGIRVFTENEELLTRASSEAQSVVEKHFTIDIMAERYLDIYSSLLSKSSDSRIVR